MVGFTLPLSAEQRKLQDSLLFLRQNTSCKHQAELLEKRALKLFHRNHRIPTRGARLKRIVAVVERLCVNIDSIIPISPEQNSPDIDRHEEYCEFLRRGAAGLNSETTRSRSRTKNDALKEEDAIKKDKEVIMEAIQNEATRVRPIEKSIRLFKMDHPKQDPQTISGKFATYYNLLVYLNQIRVAAMPELWIRLHKQHKLTTNGYMWQHVDGPKPVESHFLDLDVVETKGRSGYIVALLHGRPGDEEEEIPVPLNVNKVGEACCSHILGEPGCVTLGNHLKHLWPERIVKVAKLFSDCHNNIVLATEFNNGLFTERSNDLYLQWESVPTSSEPLCTPSP